MTRKVASAVFESPVPSSVPADMSPSTVIALRLVHILVGVMWAGGVVFIAVFLLPTIRATGPAGGTVMQHLVGVRRLPVFIMSSAIITILSGLALYWNDSAGFTAKVWLASGQGRTLGLGAVLGIITGIIGGTVNSPTAAKLTKLGTEIQAAAGQPSAEQATEMMRLREMLTRAQSIAAVLLVLTAACMAVARYIV